MSKISLDYAAIDSAAMKVFSSLLRKLLPNGRVEGSEYVELNPTRDDQRLGSFKINIRSGRWADFATEYRGCGPVSLIAYLFNLKPSEAARELSRMLELNDAA